LLVDVTALVATGRPMAVTTCPKDDDEFRKRITSIALAGDQLVSIDNIGSALGCASLDAALTATVWKDRVLGSSEMTSEMPLRATWFGTGNNVTLLADTARRTAHIRLETKHENPEEREGFQHPDLRTWVLSNRGRLLAAALSILRGYVASGRPDQRLKSWGSYEGWSDLVRSAVVWCGLADPGLTRQELRRTADQDANALPFIIAGLEKLDPDGNGLTITDIVERIGQQATDTDVKAMRETLIMTCKSRKDFPSPDSIGRKFSHLRGRICGGKSLHRKEGRYAEWLVMTLRT